ncbi:N-acetyllactosaminide beta-1,3-N-acetylglucosaminyltransferase 4 isoform X2 [Hydra vulgaris]|uniref:Hexosyltransferase n=1 Tax=Hydra vulgaris TaxID=6087 RepID=A0ABM4DK66_HYDVU
MKIIIRIPRLTTTNKRRIGIAIALLIAVTIYYYGNKVNNTYVIQKYLTFSNYIMWRNKTLEIKSSMEKGNLSSIYKLNINSVNTNTIKKQNLISHVNVDIIEKDHKVKYTVLILISSHVLHRSRRFRIRETWGNSSMWTTKHKYKIVFVTGNVEDNSKMMEIVDEAKLWKDVISLDISEEFYLLSKKVIVALSWAKENFNFKAILKGDDDTFINLDNVINFINENKISDGYFGSVLKGQIVNRDGKYILTQDEHKKNIFDPYCSGGGYILTNSSAQKIIPMLDFETNITNDDAYVGKIALTLGIVPTNSKGFHMRNTWCEYVKNFKVSHPIDDPDCNSFLLKKSRIDNGQLRYDPQLEKQKYYKNAALLKYFAD